MEIKKSSTTSMAILFMLPSTIILPLIKKQNKPVLKCTTIDPTQATLKIERKNLNPMKLKRANCLDMILLVEEPDLKVHINKK